MWRELNKLYWHLQEAEFARRALESPYDYYQAVEAGSALFQGLCDNGSSHDAGWQFIQLGRHIERADKTSRLLDVKYFLLLPTAADVGTTIVDSQWAAVLRSASAFEMYRKRYGRLVPERIVEFLLLDVEFPRAVKSCLTRARESAHAISGTPISMCRHPLEQTFMELCSELAYARVETLIANGLHEYLDDLQTRMNDIGSGIMNTFFATADVGDGKPRPS
jgi:uncharacterized alpha-E superfamily protein